MKDQSVLLLPCSRSYHPSCCYGELITTELWCMRYTKRTVLSSVMVAFVLDFILVLSVETGPRSVSSPVSWPDHYITVAFLC